TAGEAYLNFNQQPPGGLPSVIAWQIQNLLADTKFVTLFSLLSGIGLAMQAQRLEQISILHRRLIALRVIGLLHITLLWGGDMLLLYALAGGVAFLCRRHPPAQQAIIGGVGIGLTMLLTLVISLLVFAVDLPADSNAHAAG